MNARDRSRHQATPFWTEAAAAGAIGAATIAIWFLALDVLQGRPLYTPTLLGTALVRGPGLASPETLPISVGMVLLFTLAHGVVFLAIGAVAAGLIRLAEKNANYGFGLILFFVFFLCGFLFVAMIFAEDVLRALAWPAIFGGNLLAVVAIAFYFKPRHPNVRMRP
ncbi:MAG: hypothetical protein ACRD1B_00045 [Thermoanaerobaculia bacterium]